MSAATAIEHEDTGGGGAFVLRRDGERAGELFYALEGGRMVITHTEVLPALRGGGLARALVDAAAAWARARGLKILPRCSYARLVLQRTPALADLIQ